MKCKYCGKDLMDGAKFCVYCGKPIEVEEPKIVKPEPKVEENVQSSSTVVDPFAILEQKKAEAITQPAVSQVPEVPAQPAVASIPVQPEVVPQSIAQEPSAPVKDPFESLDQNVVEEETPEITPTEEVPSVPVENKTLEQVKEEITNVTVKPKVEGQKETSKEPASIQPEVVQQPEPTPIELPKEPEKQEINIETKVIKKNNPILIIIIFILLVIIIGGGAFVYTKYIAPSNNKNSSNTATTDKKVEEEVKEYDLAKAKELIDKYYYKYTAQPDQNLFTADMTEDVKKNIALNNLKNEFKKIECSQITGFETSNTGQCIKLNNSSVFTEGRNIDYDSLNNKYKYLFGKTTEVSKEAFSDLTYFVSWEYMENKNIFLQTIGIGGLEGASNYSNYFVKKAEISGDSLIIDVAYIYMSAKDLTSGEDPELKTEIAGEEVTYKESETKKDTFEQEIKDKYLDKLDTYEFTFKYEDDHYIYVDMKKI